MFDGISFDSIAHLAVDVLPGYTLRLPAARRTGFPVAERELADALLPSIRTFWIACGDSERYSEKFDPDVFTHDGMTRCYGLPPLRPGEPLFIKDNYDAFQSKAFEDILVKAGISTLIMTGGNTDWCFKDSLNGALLASAKFKIVVPYDSLIDGNFRDEEANPNWHKLVIEKAKAQLPRDMFRRLTIAKTKQVLSAVSTLRSPSRYDQHTTSTFHPIPPRVKGRRAQRPVAYSSLTCSMKLS